MESKTPASLQLPQCKIDHAQLQRDMEAAAKDHIDRTLKNHMRQLFQDGSWHGQPEGFAHALIKSRIDNFFTSDRCVEMIDAAIEVNAEAGFDHAAKKLLQSRSRKKLFENPATP